MSLVRRLPRQGWRGRVHPVQGQRVSSHLLVPSFFCKEPGTLTILRAGSWPRSTSKKGEHDTHGVRRPYNDVLMYYMLCNKANHGITSKVGKQLRGLASHLRIERRGPFAKNDFALAVLHVTASGWLVQSSLGSRAIERSPLYRAQASS